MGKYWIILIVFMFLAIFFLMPKKIEKESVVPVSQNENSETEPISVVASDLYVPWSMEFLPNGTLVFTERNGILHIGELEFEIAGVEEIGEGGLMGVALHPDFVNNNFLYLYFTTRANGTVINRVERFVFENNTLSSDRIILDNIPGGLVHNGGRIHFGPDKMLYITTGDAGKENLAQDKNSLAGKILRLNDDGTIPNDNPFGTAIYSYGHRNPQGLAWDTNGNLWASEHGRSGLQSGLDEINLIQKGGNYGWPVIEGDETREGMIGPVIHSGASTTWAPSGIAFLDGKLFFVGLRGRALYETEVLSGGRLGEVKVHFKDVYGRLRGVTSYGENLYISTSNRDGRGSPKDGDDKIIKITF